ncbi:hypothetical protein J2I47_16055 [Fibrella sp. HMF5335]|uniref:Uncharacterized protein n=1 Tax=Fibrella rubiginis TaxID=2817060 RepID=A0A939GF96_9BACT|nr:hypothetical protein [Fibrella rubiginis]MBO0938067.1 hypothetical protein [Fibrella rubiginis]
MLGKRRSDLLGLLFVLLSSWVLIYQITHRLDIVATDDDVYFRNGLNATWRNLPPTQMAPLFSLWYIIIQAFTGNVISTYYVSWAIMSVLPGLGFYALLRSLRVGVPTSVWLTVFFLFCPLNFPLSLKVSVFTMLWLMGGLVVANRTVSPLGKLVAAAAGALLATYGRPEFYLGFILLSILAAGYWFWQRRRQGTQTSETAHLPYALISLVGVAAVLVLWLGFPLAGGRSHIAFGQHFAMNYAVWHPGFPFSPWMHSQEFIRAGFGRDITSMGDAFFLNPSMFMKHVGQNLINLVKMTAQMLQDVLITPWLSRLVFPGRRYLILAMLVTILGITNWKQSLINWRAGFRRDGWFWVCVLLCIAPTFISCILIYPREHYVVFHLLAYIPLAGVLLRDWATRPLLAKQPASLAYIATTLLLGVFLWPHWQTARQPRPRPIAHLLTGLQQIPVQGHVNMIGSVPLLYKLYLGENWNFDFLEQYRPKDMQAFMAERKINCVYMRPEMVAEYGKDTYFAQLVADPGSLGFTRYPVSPTETAQPDRCVLVKNELVAANHSPRIP